MRRHSARFAARIIMFVFMTSLGTSAFNVKWLTHEMGHDLRQFAVHDVGAAHHHHGDPLPDSQLPLSDSEHGALHAAIQLVTAPAPDFRWHAPDLRGAAVTTLVVSQAPRAIPEAPFRPPRQHA